MHTEHARLETLGKLFDCSQLLAGATTSVAATSAELAALRAVWQRAAATEKKLAEWNQTVGWGRQAGGVRVDRWAGMGSLLPGSILCVLKLTTLCACCPTPAPAPPCSCLRLSTCLSWRRVPRG